MSRGHLKNCQHGISLNTVYFFYSQQMKQAPDKFDSHLSEQNHLAATHLLVGALGRLGGDLKEIGGLSEIRTLVEKRREVRKEGGSTFAAVFPSPLDLQCVFPLGQKLYSTLMDNLGWLLYHGLEAGDEGALGIGGGGGSNLGSGRRGRGGGSGRGGGGGGGSGRGGSGRSSGGRGRPPPGTTFSQQHLLRTLQNRNMEVKERT